ncbi:restriction endonuclease subunit S [Streptomyces sp. CNQ431]|uniref:restriction endonuclease subunit S n=1 Tax=Streptomyces sp. CNQ431 TaxID=1571532 RepID=UPI00099C5630|nr:restriction endonuclease subunit S [Streptomyces sp. CNQ431]
MSSVFDMQLPPTWASAPLKHVVTKLHRGSAPTYVDDGPVRAISQAANQASGLDWSRTRYHDFLGDPTRLKGYLHPCDVLVNSTGTGTLGRVGYFVSPSDGIPCMADSHVTIVRPNSSGLDSRFAFYWLGSQPFQEYIFAALVVGATNQIELNRDRLGEAPVPLPPLSEQRRIADFLDVETALIDRLVSAREKQVEVLDECEYAEVTDGLIPGSLDSPSGEWPWIWLPAPVDDAPLVRLGYVARLQSGLTVDGKRDLSGDVVTRPYLRVANVQADRIQVDDVSEITVPANIAKRSTLLAGDVLMTEGGDLDKLGRGTVWRGELERCLHQNHVFAVRPDGLRLDAEYLSLMTRTVHGRCYFESTGVKTTNLASTNSSKILGFPIPLPSLEIQRLRVHTVQRKLDGSARAKQCLRAQLELLGERRQALITAAVTGQLDVTTSRPAHDRDL